MEGRQRYVDDGEVKDHHEPGRAQDGKDGPAHGLIAARALHREGEVIPGVDGDTRGCGTMRSDREKTSGR